MDYRKEIIEMIQKIRSESMIKFIYGCVKKGLQRRKQRGIIWTTKRKS